MQQNNKIKNFLAFFFIFYSNYVSYIHKKVKQGETYKLLMNHDYIISSPSNDLEGQAMISKKLTIGHEI